MASPPAPKPAGVLRPWQRRLYGLLLIPLGLIAANAIYLASFTRDAAFFYAMLLLHLTLGLLIAVPFFVFAVTHARRMIRMWNKRAKYAGLAIFTLAVVCVSTGIFMTFQGATLNNRAVWLGHVLSVPLALVAFILHRRAHTHKLQFRRLYAWGGAVALFLGAMAVMAKLEKPPKRIVNVNGDTVFFPSSSETFDQGLLDAKKLAANGYCQSCHPDSFHQWERSAHRFSSFNNPFYRKSVELMADRVGRERTKWCSGCHDPVVLFTGQMGAATQAKFSYDSWEAQQGLTCMSCHSIVEVKDVKGNGSYVIEEAKQYPFAFSRSKTLQAVNRLLIRMEPSLHRKTFLKPVHRTPEFCSSCHKVALIPALNSYRWMRGQNHYDTWYDSGVSGRAVRSFYDPPQPKACRDCHLPPYPSQEFGNRKGQVHDHLFPAANTALPFVRGDRKTKERIREFLQNKVLTADIFAIKRGDALTVLGEEPVTVAPGETIGVEVVVRTRGVGHPYTNGTADSNETWLSLEGEAGKAPFFRSGVLDAAGRLDPAADMLSLFVIGHDGDHMDRRQPQDIHVPLYNNGIGPGAARVVHYRMTVPRDAKEAVRLSAGVQYRKFSRDYTTFSLGASAPSLPVTTLAGDSVDLGVAPLPSRPLTPSPAERGRSRTRSGCDGTTTASGSSCRETSRRGAGVDEDRGAPPRQAGRAFEPRPRRDRGGAARPTRRPRSRRRSGPAGLGEDGLLPRDRRQGGGTSGRGARRICGTSSRSSRSTASRGTTSARSLARRQVPRGNRGVRQDTRDRLGGPDGALQPDARLPRHGQPREGGVPRGLVPQVQGGRDGTLPRGRPAAP